jgi:hypothetical protein
MAPPLRYFSVLKAKDIEITFEVLREAIGIIVADTTIRTQRQRRK